MGVMQFTCPYAALLLISRAGNVRSSAGFLVGTSLCLLCLIHSRYIIMIVIIAVMIAVTGTVMTTDIPTATEMDRPTQD